MLFAKEIQAIDWSRYRFTPWRVFAGSAVLLAIAISVSIVQFSNAKDNVLPGGSPVGGDYVAFYGAALATAQGDAVSTYDKDAFEAHLKEIGPPRERYGLTFQYPPTYLFFIAPLAFMPFVLGYIIWSGASAALFLGLLRWLGFSGLFVFTIAASPSVFQGVITGQNGFLTASLLILAALFAKDRPIIAGLCAALLTVKPQLGVLLPLAFIAGGCWRAFWVASIASLGLIAASLGIHGLEVWAAFYESLSQTSGRLSSGLMPLYKMVTPFTFLRHLGFPDSFALGLHIMLAGFAAMAVVRVWSRLKDVELRAAVLLSAVFFVAPYGFYYEILVLAFPAAVLAKRGLEQGFLRGESFMIAAMMLLPMTLPGTKSMQGFSTGFLCVALVAAGVLRRVHHEAPHIFPEFRTATPPQPLPANH